MCSFPDEVSEIVAVSGQQSEATNLNEDLMTEVRNIKEQVRPEGAWIAADESVSEGEGDNVAAGAALSQTKKRKGRASTDTDIHKANTLSRFICTESCHQLVWDSFFENNKKCKWDVKEKTHRLTLQSATYLSHQHCVPTHYGNTLLRQSWTLIVSHRRCGSFETTRPRVQEEEDHQRRQGKCHPWGINGSGRQWFGWGISWSWDHNVQAHDIGKRCHREVGNMWWVIKHLCRATKTGSLGYWSWPKWVFIIVKN